MTSPPSPTAKPSTTQWHLGLLALVSILMSWVSWRKWPDFFIDYGLNLYIPWRLAEGDVMYRDFHYMFGPVSQYFHAGLFQIFGTGFSTLIYSNFVLVAGYTLLIYFLFRKLAYPITGLFCGLAFLLVFCFAHYMGMGSFNFVTPYLYEVTQGIFLSFVALHFFLKYLDRPRTAYLVALGILTGLVFMTKVEVFFAEAVALGTGLFLAFRFNQVKAKRESLHWAVFFLSTLLPPVLTVLALSSQMPLDQAMDGLIRPYNYVLHSPLPDLPLYRWVIGMEPLHDNLIRIGLCFLGYLLIFGMALGINHQVRNDSKKIGWALAGILFLIALAVLALFRDIHWVSLVAGLQLFLAGYALLTLWNGCEKVRKGTNCKEELGNLAFTAFSLALLAKIFFNVHVHHFGFALALPGTLMLIKVMTHDLPAQARRISSDDRFVKGFAGALLSIALASFAFLNSEAYRAKTYPVGADADQIIDYHPAIHPRGPQIDAVLSFMKQHMQPGDRVGTLPSGILFNYLLRSPHPVYFFTMFPFDDPIFGKDALLHALVEKPPRWIILSETRFRMMGTEYFGEDYAVSAYQWIRKHYHPVFTAGATPFTQQGFGIQVLENNLGVTR